MDRIVVTGGVPLRGTIDISGAKNAALPLLATALLTDEPVSLEAVPDLADTASMLRLLQVLGVEARHLAGAPGRVTLHCPEVMSTTAPYDLVRKMRASVLVLGPLVARCGKASVSLPGGCAIGTRPIDLHLAGLEALGAEIELDGGYVHARAPGGLKGGVVQFRQPSVGATENILMAASLARGESVIVNAAREPEIVDLAHCLRALGAVIEGEGASEIRVQGQPRLHAGTHRIMADRIEAGTYAMAAAITGGEIELRNATLDMLGAARETLEDAGV